MISGVVLSLYAVLSLGVILAPYLKMDVTAFRDLRDVNTAVGLALCALLVYQSAPTQPMLVFAAVSILTSIFSANIGDTKRMEWSLGRL